MTFTETKDDIVLALQDGRINSWSDMKSYLENVLFGDYDSWDIWDKMNFSAICKIILAENQKQPEIKK